MTDAVASPREMISEGLSILRRRWLLCTGVVSIGVAASIAYALVQPPIYRTQAKILIENQQIPEALARPIVNSSAVERLELIKQRVLSRDRLRDIVDRFDLFFDRPDLQPNDKVNKLRDATEIRSIASDRRNWRDGSISAFTIAVTLKDPEKAAAAANGLVDLVLEQNLRVRAESARETFGFFDREVRRLSAELAQLEGRITEFKTENEGRLPDSLEFRRSEIARMHSSRLELDRRLLELEEQRRTLEMSLNAGGPLATQQLSEEERELRRLELELAEKRLIFSSSHPEVQSARRRIRVLERFLTERSGEPLAETGAESVRLSALRRQIQVIETQIALAEEQRHVIDTRLARLETSIEATPKVEVALSTLERRHEELREQYAATVRKRAEAETGERLEENQQAERFEVVENALVPRTPVAPDRRKLVILGSVASVALAAGIALFLELLNPAIRTSAQMRRALNMQPVVAIPRVRTRVEHQRKRRLLTAAVAILALVVPSGLWVVDRHVRPLEQIADRVVETSGIKAVVQRVRASF